MKRTIPLVLALLGGVAAGSAMAAGNDVGGYVGLGLGRADWKAGSIDGITGDSHGTATKLFGGYNFSPNLGLELGYADLGKFGGNGSGDARAHSTSLDGIGRLPLNDTWSLIGRLGLADTRVRATTVGAEASDGGTGLHAGLGLQYQLTPNAGIRAEWERYRVKAFSETSHTDLTTVGFVWGF